VEDLDLINCPARGLPPEERPTYLTQACAGDPGLRACVEQMLSVANEVEAFITDQPDAELEERSSRPERAKPPKVEPADIPDGAIGQTFGRYKPLQKIGDGGCGVAYMAEQDRPVRRRVALKVINSVIIPVASALMGLGFFLWYFKVQAYQDRILRKEAEERAPKVKKQKASH
jgi:hypothetical protein